MGTMSPVQRSEYEHQHYGWNATTERLERHISELASAVNAWDARDLEQRKTHYGLALEIERISRNISAETSQLARLASYQ